MLYRLSCQVEAARLSGSTPDTRACVGVGSLSVATAPRCLEAPAFKFARPRAHPARQRGEHGHPGDKRDPKFAVLGAAVLEYVALLGGVGKELLLCSVRPSHLQLHPHHRTTQPQPPPKI